MILAKDGTYRLYPISPSDSEPIPTTSSSSTSYSQHSLAHDVQESTVVDARIYESGMIVLLSSHQFLEVKGWPERDALNDSSAPPSLLASQSYPADDRASPSLGSHGRGRIERFVPSGLEKLPSAWCMLTPDQSTSRQVEVLMSSGATLLSIDQLDIQDQRFSHGPFSHIVPSPSGRFMALLTSNQPQKLYVVSSNYAETLSEYDLATESETIQPKAVLWCGNNCVVLAWDTTIVLVGPFGQTLR